jgi:hypothetical protein
MNVKRYILLPACVLFVAVPAAVAAPHLDHMLYKGKYEAIGWEIKYGLSPTLGYRFSGYERVGMRDKQKEYTRSVMRFDNKALSTFLDWHPAENSFRTSIGIFASSQYMEYFAEPTVDLRFNGAFIHVDKSRFPDEIVFRDQVIDLSRYGIEKSITIKGRTISGYKSSIPQWIIIDPQVFQLHRDDIHITASADFKPLASYFGIGWGNRPLSDQRLRYSVDIGIIYLGHPDVTLTANGSLLQVDPSLTEELRDYVAKEERRLQRKAENMRLMPYMSFGLSLGF